MATGKEKLPKGVQIQTPAKTTMATKCKQAKKQQFALEDLPAVVLDKILGLLQPQDLRRFHQVSKAWKYTLSSRSIIERRRIDLVNKIRLNKENNAKGNLLDTATPNTKQNPAPRKHDGKPGSRVILGSRVSNSDNSRPTSVPSSTRRPTSTPTSRIIRDYDAGKKLLKGQVLFRCPSCRSPVASPVPPSRFQGSEHNTANKILSSSLNLTHDSGFESIEVSTDPFNTIDDHSITCDTSTEEISLSFIATPPQPGPETCIGQYQVTPINSSTQDNGCSSRSSSSYEMEALKCPECCHRFCCKCQCTEHPGKSCKEIDGDSIFPQNSSLRSESKDNDLKLGKRKTLRRLARI